MADEQNSPPESEAKTIPAAVPEPGSGAGGMSTADEETGVSGLLVMWGPLIIIGLLIFVFSGNEREAAAPVAATEKPVGEVVIESVTASLPAPAPLVPDLDSAVTGSGSDLAEAFKAAGIPLPQAARPAAPAPGVPAELSASPWAPGAGTPAPPGYATAPPRGAYGGGHMMPPPGYGYGYGGYPYQGGYPGGYPGQAMPYAGYGHPGWAPMPHGYGAPAYGSPPGPPPGYGPRGYGMPHHGHGAMHGTPQAGVSGSGEGNPATGSAASQEAAPPPPTVKQ